MERRCCMLLVLVVLLVVMAGAAIAVDMKTWQGRRAENIRIFQRAAGGLGMGCHRLPHLAVYQLRCQDSFRG